MHQGNALAETLELYSKIGALVSQAHRLEILFRRHKSSLPSLQLPFGKTTKKITQISTHAFCHTPPERTPQSNQSFCAPIHHQFNNKFSFYRQVRSLNFHETKKVFKNLNKSLLRTTISVIFLKPNDEEESLDNNVKSLLHRSHLR